MTSTRHVLWPRPLSSGCLMARRLRALLNGSRAIRFLVSGLVVSSLLTSLADDSGGKKVALVAADSDDSHTNGLGSWIWTARTSDRQTCQTYSPSQSRIPIGRTHG